MSHALALAQRQSNPITVLFLDLDDFKRVNDSLGHAEGDRLLIAAAERFLSCARAADTVARLGGDEFAILLEHSAGPEAGPSCWSGSRTAMVTPVHAERNQVQVSASIGVATAGAGESADDLLRNADVAMYAAKRRGKALETSSRGCTPTCATGWRWKLRSARAIEGGQLTLHYQPMVRSAPG